MKKITLLVLTIFCAQVIMAQMENEPEFNAVNATYVGKNNDTYYFKTIEDGKVLQFNKLGEKASEKIDSGIDLSNGTLLLQIKTNLIEQKKEASKDDSMDASTITYTKVLSLEDLDFLSNKEDEELEELEEFDDDDDDDDD